jgi:hypothetical protein
MSGILQYVHISSGKVPIGWLPSLNRWRLDWKVRSSALGRTFFHWRHRRQRLTPMVTQTSYTFSESAIQLQDTEVWMDDFGYQMAKLLSVKCWQSTDLPSNKPYFAHSKPAVNGQTRWLSEKVMKRHVICMSMFTNAGGLVICTHFIRTGGDRMTSELQQVEAWLKSA